MRERANKGAAWGTLLVLVAVVIGGLVWAAFGRDHTKTVTVTKTHTVVVTKRVAANATWDRTAQSLANYLRPQRAQEFACGKGAPSGERCYAFVFGQNYVVTLAQPSP